MAEESKANCSEPNKVQSASKEHDELTEIMETPHTTVKVTVIERTGSLPYVEVSNVARGTRNVDPPRIPSDVLLLIEAHERESLGQRATRTSSEEETCAKQIKEAIEKSHSNRRLTHN